MLVNRLCGLALPFTAKRFVDDVAGRGQWHQLPALAVIIGVAAMVGAVTTYGLTQLLGVAAQRAIADVRATAVGRAVRWPIRELERQPRGALISRLWHDAETIRPLLGRDIVQLVASTLTAAVALAALVAIDMRLTLAMLALLAVFGVGVAFASSRMRPLYHERSRILAQTSGRLGEALGGIRVIKAHAAEPREDAVFAAAADRLLDNVARTLTGAGLVTAVATVLVGAAAIVLMLVGGAAVRAGTMTAGDVAMYVSFLALLTLPVMQLSAASGPLQEAMVSLERMATLHGIQTESEEDAARGATSVATHHRSGGTRSSVRGEVIFDRVTFAYGPGQPVLRDVSLRAAAGTTIALVGSSGAGKSTLVGLVMALDRPQSGRVFIDGDDLGALARDAIRSRVGAVIQDDFLFDGTVAENIAFSNPDATREAVVRAGQLAHCDEFVDRFPDGYDTRIGERGIRLSGGQRQRVSIARALIADPEVLILDEATSSLDSETELLIQDALRTLRRGRTTFVIAHRLSTIVAADQILVMERGEIVERGRHDDLLRRGGRYRQLYDGQYGHTREATTEPAPW